MNNNTYNILAIAVLGLLAQQACYGSEKSFIKNAQKKLELSNPNHQYACHGLGLFSSGIFYKESKNTLATPFVYGTVAFIGCPAVINSSLFVSKKIKRYILNHTEPQRPRIKEKK